MVRYLIQRHGVVAQEAALADLVAVPVKKGHAKFVGEIDLALRDLEGRQRKRQDDQEPRDAQREPLAGELVAGAEKAFNFKASEERGVGAPPVAEADPRAIEAGIDPRIDLQPIYELAAAIAL